MSRHKRNIRVAIWKAGFLGFCLLACGCNQDPGVNQAELDRIAVAREVELVQASGGLVLMVEKEALSSDEVISAPIERPGISTTLSEYLKPLAQQSTLETFRQQAYLHVKDALMGKITSILLYREAQRKAGDDEQVNETLDNLAEKELLYFIMQYRGDQAKADEELAKQGMTREKFKEEHKKFIITQSYIASQLPEDQLITYSDLTECYDRIKDQYFATPARIQFRLIDIDVAKVSLEYPGADPFEKARTLARDILEKIRAGEDFGKLAQQYSHGHRSRFQGLWEPVSPDSLARPYDVLVPLTETIDAGRVIGPVEAGLHLFIMKLEDKQAEGYEPFLAVQRTVEQELRRQRREDVILKLGRKLLDQAALGKADELVDFCVDKIYEMAQPGADVPTGQDTGP